MGGYGGELRGVEGGGGMMLSLESNKSYSLLVLEDIVQVKYKQKNIIFGNSSVFSRGPNMMFFCIL